MRTGIAVQVTGRDTEAIRQADAAINAVVGAKDYGGENVRSVCVKLLPKAPRGGLKRKRVYPGSFAEHLYLEGLLPSPLEARSLIDAVAETLGSESEPMFGVDLMRLSRDVAKATRQLPLRVPIEEVELDNAVRFVVFDEKRRRRLRRPLSKRLVGIRTYASKELDSMFSAEPDVLGDILGNALARQGFMTPGYSEIYFNIASTLDEARRMGSAREEWHENAYLVIDPAQYAKASTRKREDLLVEGFAAGMSSLAAVDGLHRPSIRRAIDVLRSEGQEAELLGPSAEDEHHHAQVVFRHQRGDACNASFRLVVTNKATGSRREHALGKHSTWAWPYCFARVSLSKSSVRIDAAKGARADAYLKKAKRRLEFELG